ncbi:hypothetical protein H114_32594 [Streptomyces gancidicus BKS 13-15]|uniref:Uncharacterized protein n=1 Tax=Streptomyces gancidicus BKS 13-15 TaxID=1284664 RepID=M3CS95_STREZ|nr:hypothetical protein [Streptomyces gancidicus]EMF20380.1 hypothetical protein H114_32594 [Streptomyces gancidicus BKS 13-15]
MPGTTAQHPAPVDEPVYGRAAARLAARLRASDPRPAVDEPVYGDTAANLGAQLRAVVAAHGRPF